MTRWRIYGILTLFMCGFLAIALLIHAQAEDPPVRKKKFKVDTTEITRQQEQQQLQEQLVEQKNFRSLIVFELDSLLKADSIRKAQKK